METLQGYLTRKLWEAQTEQMRSLGYWCPRCDIEAFPTALTEPAGWCPICGMDPLVEGPRKPFARLRGIR
jgi:rubrerythrin